jgi:hypothetical protein
MKLCARRLRGNLLDISASATIDNLAWKPAGRGLAVMLQDRGGLLGNGIDVSRPG